MNLFLISVISFLAGAGSAYVILIYFPTDDDDWTDDDKKLDKTQ